MNVTVTKEKEIDMNVIVMREIATEIVMKMNDTIEDE